MADETGEGKFPSSPVAHRPNPADRQPLVSGEAAWEQARATAIPIWGEGWREAHQSSIATTMAVGQRGAPVRGSTGCRWLGW
jgi:hypothetical protein